jgi:Ca2+-transporting ATPase
MVPSQGQAEDVDPKATVAELDVRILHSAVRGRVRIHVTALYRDRQATLVFERVLRLHPAVRAVTPNPYTGNVLILFDPALSHEYVVDLIVELCRSPRRQPSIRSGTDPRHRDTSNDRHEPNGLDSTRVAWHAMDSDLVLVHLEATANGLTRDEARRRLQRFGRNELKAAVKRPLSEIVAAQFKSLPVLLLIGSSVLSVLTGGFTDAVVILGVIGLNAFIGAYTEAAAERTILSLTRFSAPPVRTERNGATDLVDVGDLVPGDVIQVTRGDYVGADARLLHCADLSVAESALTGESAPVSKDALRLVGEGVPLGDRLNMIYRGTVVTGGSGVAVVVATGARTELGRIQELVAQAVQPDTPLQRQLQTLGHQMAIATSAVCGGMVVIGVFRGYGVLEIVRVAISLAVAAIPEGLPTVSTVTLSTGVRRLRKQGLLVRRLNAVETLGAVQVICLDKTGTITANRMVAQVAYVDGRKLRFEKVQARDLNDTQVAGSENLARLLRVGALCSNATVTTDSTGQQMVDGTPTESALVHLALDRGIDVTALRAAYPLLSHLERSEQRMYMTTIHGTPTSGRLIATKGRPDQVLSRCRAVLKDGAVVDLTAADRIDIETENESLAGQGLRVLGFAFSEVDGNDEDADAPLVWAGLLGIADPPRSGIRTIIEALHVAGVQTVMITGDQSATACAVARSIGLGRGGELQVLDSTGLAGIPDVLLSALASRVDVFSRVSPSNKLQIVTALQQAGRVVAMTGDGVNDGPALRASNVGIAMGRGGSELAREVADIVLLDDDVGALLEAVAEGRTTADDIRKSVHFIVSTNLSEILFTLGATALGFGVPLSATQLLWINLLTDVFPELALAVDPAEGDVMRRPPRDSGAKLVSARDYSRLAVEASVMTGAAMASYLSGMRRYGQAGGASTMGFLSLTATQLLHAFSSRSDTHSVFDLTQRPNPWLGLSVAGGFAVQGVAAFVPGLRRVLGLVRVGPGDVALSWGLAALSFALGETLKVLTPGERSNLTRSNLDPPPAPPPAGPAASVAGAYR